MRNMGLSLALAAAMAISAGPAFGQGVDITDMKQASASYVLTEATIRQFIAMTDDARKLSDMSALTPPKMPTSGTATVATMAAAMEAHPPMKALLTRHGLTGRDVLLIPVAYMQAAMLVQAPPDAVAQLATMAGVNVANIPLVREKGAVLTPLLEGALQSFQPTR